jgi:peroxiredoxin
MTHLKVGDNAPNFKLHSHLGGQVDLAELRGRTVALVFFPLAWTPI